MTRLLNYGIWVQNLVLKHTGTILGIYNELNISMVTNVAVHPAGTIIASASTDRSIKLFDIRTHKLIQHYGEAHGPISNSTENPMGGVNSIAFGGLNGEWLISTGMDGVVKVISRALITRSGT
jgi:WD40 repeat protein